LPERFHAPASEPARYPGAEANARLEGFFAATGLDIRTSPEPQAYYDPQGDFIHMPPIARFEDTEKFYGVLAHEATHATGHASCLMPHASRLDRFGRFNDRKAYAATEAQKAADYLLAAAGPGQVAGQGEAA